MREAILLFSAEEKLAVYLRKVLAPMRIMVRTIPTERFNCSIGYLAGNKSCPAAETPYVGEPLAHPLLLLAGFGNARMDQALNAMRRSGLYIDYKAMLTPTNQFWDVPTLYHEIAREHEALQNDAADETP